MNRYPQAEKSVLSMDNLHTPTLASLYEALPPTAARRLRERLEMHHTPKHGSWLNMAETERSILATQCLDRRIPKPLTLPQDVAAWERQRKTAKCRVEWRFTTQDARIKLKRLCQFSSVAALEALQPCALCVDWPLTSTLRHPARSHQDAVCCPALAHDTRAAAAWPRMV